MTPDTLKSPISFSVNRIFSTVEYRMKAAGLSSIGIPWAATERVRLVPDVLPVVPDALAYFFDDDAQRTPRPAPALYNTEAMFGPAASAAACRSPGGVFLQRRRRFQRLHHKTGSA
jgi:hypothetical protein